MKPDIKHRIEQLRRGEVPEGYKKTKAGIMPKEWEEKKIKEVAPLQRGFDLPSYDIKNGKYPICYSNGISAYHSEFKVLGPGVWTGRSGTMGMVFYTEDNFWPHNTCLWVTNFFKNNPKFIFYLFNFLDFNKYNAGSSVPTLNRNDIHVLEVGLPPLPEQQKIADILSTQDKVIELKEQLLAQKQQQKKYLMQLLLTGKKRLPGFSGEWKKEKLENILKERKTYSTKSTEYPHVTLSIDGIYLKNERYDRDHLVKDENKQYKVTHKDDICYNPANLKFGVLCQNTFGDAIFSPIYITFEVIENICKEYLAGYLMRWDFINAVRKYEEGTVYERMAVKPEDFLKYEILLPPFEEQTAIANVLSTADREIDLLRQSIEAEKQKKKALMQLLLTGIVRVNV